MASRGRPIEYPDLHSETKLRELYKEDGLSINQLATHFGCSRFAVVYALDKFSLRN